MSGVKRTRVKGTKGKCKRRKHVPIFSLNHDCLAEVLSYLPLKDVCCVRRADRRFKEGCQLRYAREAVDCINTDFMLSIPKSCLAEFLIAFGRACRSIKLEDLQENTFWIIISHFTNLQELSLSQIHLEEEERMAVLPVDLKSLVIEDSYFSEAMLNSWIPKLDDSLTSLRINCHLTYHNVRNIMRFQSLHNLNTFVIDAFMDGYLEMIGDLLVQNRDTLTNLSLIIRDQYIPRSYWTAITELDNLTHLHWDQYLDYGEKEFVPHSKRLFPKLVSLNLKFWGKYFEYLINNLACEESLLSFVSERSFKSDLAVLQKFRNLQHLDVCLASCNSSTVKVLLKFRQLQTLNLSGSTFESLNDLLEIVRSMPWLRKLGIDDIAFRRDDVGSYEFENMIAVVRRQHPQPLEIVWSLYEPPYYEDVNLDLHLYMPTW